MLTILLEIAEVILYEKDENCFLKMIKQVLENFLCQMLLYIENTILVLIFVSETINDLKFRYE